MYGTAAEMAIKESPSVAFSVLTKVTLSIGPICHLILITLQASTHTLLTRAHTHTHTHTQFNIPSWLVNSDPSGDDRSQLLQFISQGLCLSGATPGRDNALLVEVSAWPLMWLMSRN